MRIERVNDLDALGSAVATAILGVCRARQAEDAVPCLVLTGGGAGARILAALAEHPERDSVNWRRVRFVWGDERWVPSGHADRNDRLADETLFGAVETDPALVHRMPASDAGLSLDAAAEQYAETIERVERVDVALNGVGEDGHVASLFPGRDDLLRDDPGTPAALPVRESPKPPPERITLSLPELRRAERVWLLVSGEGKGTAVRGLLDPASALPAARLRGALETVLWGDRAALGVLDAESR